VRLAEHQAEIDAILAKYPADRQRAAVMPLLHLAQREYGYLSTDALREVAGLLGLETTEVAKLVKFYTLYHAEPGGRFRVQICTDLPCALRGAEAFSAELCQRLGVKPGETTSDGQITVEQVMCLAACDMAPMFQVQGADGIHYCENQTVDSALEHIEGLRQETVDG
jgi:NADH-quinone oxidoreductase subunit E